MDNSIDRLCNIDLDGIYFRILEPNYSRSYNYFRCQCKCYFFKEYDRNSELYFICLKCGIPLNHRSCDIRIISKVKTIIL